MKKLFMLVALTITLSAQQLSIGHTVCKKKKWLYDTFEFASKKDLTSLISYQRMGRCLSVTRSVPVVIIDEQDDVVELFINGYHFWTVKEAITE